MTEDASKIAEAWIDKWSGAGPKGEETPLDWNLPRKDAALCWKVILHILEKIDTRPENKLMQALAAGPLEDLLVHNGAVVIADVEVEARRNPAFRRLLGGVWQNSIPTDIWQRAEKSRKEIW